jgi:dolichol-phosphate mannosyltransferase
MVLGSRFAPGGSVDPDWAWYRKLLSWFANSVYVRVILGSTLRDMTGGFRLWRAATLRGMDIQDRIAANGYVFQVEMAYVAQRLGYVVREVPIEFPDRTAGESKMSLRIQLEAARRTWEVRRRHRGLSPGDRAGP